MTPKQKNLVTAGLILLFIIACTIAVVVKNMGIRPDLPDPPSVDEIEEKENVQVERPEASNRIGATKLEAHPRTKIKQAEAKVGKLKESPGEDTLNRNGPSGLPLPSGVPGQSDSEKEELEKTKDNIQAAVIEMKPRVKTCYEKMLEDFPDAGGRVVVGFSIRADEDGEEGLVEMTETDPEKTTLFDRKLHDCMELAIADIRVDAPKDGVLKVNYPFNLANEPAEK